MRACVGDFTDDSSEDDDSDDSDDDKPLTVSPVTSSTVRSTSTPSSSSGPTGLDDGLFDDRGDSSEPSEQFDTVDYVHVQMPAVGHANNLAKSASLVANQVQYRRSLYAFTLKEIRRLPMVVGR